MSEDEIDQLVLEVLRELAANGAARIIGGKSVQLATGEGPYCVYKRVAISVAEKGVEVNLTTYVSRVQQYKALRDALRRLTDANMVFVNDEDIFEDSYWVAME